MTALTAHRHIAAELIHQSVAPAIPAHVADLIGRLRVLIRDGRVTAARAMLAAVTRISDACADLTEVHARVLVLEGKVPSGIAVLDAAIAAGQDTARLRLCRADLHLRQGNSVAAAADAAEAVFLDPTDPVAKACLGGALINLHRYADAIACLREALAANPANPHHRQTLAHAEELSGLADSAARTLESGIALCPGAAGLRTAAVMLRMQRKDYLGAASLADAARRDGVADACLLGLLGHARSSLGQHDGAAEAYAEARKLAPEDPYVRHLVAAAGLSADAGRAAPEYVEVVFDGYASRFDAHLISLGYRIPGLIRAEVSRISAKAGGVGPVLDLGCGTGLVGVALSDLNLDGLVGVDLSSAMLARADQWHLYAELHHADIERFLRAEARKFPLILAADVMPYFGDLAPLCGLIADRLAPGGQFLFSVEECADAAAPETCWRLGRLGRYAHGSAYVRSLGDAFGLHLRFLRHECIRLEGRAPVGGLFVGMQRRAG